MLCRHQLPAPLFLIRHDLKRRLSSEERLHSLERRHRQLIEQLPATLYVSLCLPERPVEFLNPQAERLFGPAAAQTPSLAERIVAEDRERVIAEVTRCLTAGGDISLEYRIRSDDGRVRWVRDETALLRNEEGAPLRLQGIMLDITDRKLAEAALRDSENRYRLIFDSNPSPMWVFDLESLAFLAVNEAAIRHYGYPRAAFLTMTLRDLHPPEEHARLQADAGRVHTGLSAGGLWRHRRQDGTLIDVETTSHPLEFAGRRAELAQAIDVTERLQRERELEAITMVTAALRMARSRGETCALALECAADLFQAEHVALWVRSADGEELVLEQARGGWQEAMGSRHRRGEGPVGEVWEKERPSLVNDTTGEGRLRGLGLPPEVSALALIPLVIQDQVIGVLAVGRASAFLERELVILSATADIAANAIHRASLNEKTELQVQRLTALRNLNQAIIGSLDLNLTLNLLLDQLLGQLTIDAAAVLLFQSTSGQLEYGAGRGFRGQRIRQTRLRPSEGFAGQALYERRMICLSDPQQNDQPGVRRHLFEEERFVFYCGVPLISRGQVQGVLEIFHRTPLHPEAAWLEFLESLGFQAAIALDNATLFEELQRTNTDLTLAYDSTIEGWAQALDYRDRETEGHSRRVTDMTLRMAQRLALPPAQLVHLRRGALLHDIGKMGIPDQILLKPGRLSPQEWEVMRRHPLFAFQLLHPIRYLRPAIDIPYCHHERWDGSGYPRRLKGEQIPIAARIFAVVDVWDALCSQRPYRPAWPRKRCATTSATWPAATLRPRWWRFFWPNSGEGKSLQREGSGGDELGAGSLHVLQGLAPPFDRHRPGPLHQQPDLEPFLEGVEDGGQNADVLGQAADPQPVDVVAPQLLGQPRLIEGRILILVEAHPLGHQNRLLGELQLGVKGRAVAVLQAVGRPQPPHFAKTQMAPGVPVARGIDRDPLRRGGLQPTVEHRHDLVPFGDGQTPPWTEILLHVHQQQGIPFFQHSRRFLHLQSPFFAPPDRRVS